MDYLGTLNAFVQSADTGSFVAAGRNLGLSASAVGKALARLEQRLGARLFHRNTRTMTLTEEGRLFRERCRRIFAEIEAAEMEVVGAAAEPSGRLRVSLPLVGMLLMPVIKDFMEAHPTVLLDLDFTDRLVDVIEEGFDVVVRTGRGIDSGLMRRSLGRFRGRLVASPGYLERRGMPQAPSELEHHDCLRQRSPMSGKLLDWPLIETAGAASVTIPEKMSATTIGPLLHLAEAGIGIAFLPPFAVAPQIKRGTLIPLLGEHLRETGEFAALWPASRQLSPKIRVFVNFLARHLQLEDEGTSAAPGNPRRGA
jgi:DNA-binding transcriptional LysR family regulator